MRELQRQCPCTKPLIQCTFLAINTSSVQIIPATAIAYLAANGSLHPSSVIFSALVATSISTIVAIFTVKQLAKLPVYRLRGIEAND